MKTTPLSLQISYPTLIHITSDPQGVRDAGYDVECDVNVWQNKSNDRRWRVQVSVKFKGKGATTPAHQGEVTYVGIFSVADDCPSEKMYRLIGVEAVSILYSSIRELVAVLTGRGGTRIVHLPVVSFVEGGIVPQEKRGARLRSAHGKAAAARLRVPGKTKGRARSRLKTPLRP
jgi:preprotein translocase subunit SecB